MMKEPDAWKGVEKQTSSPAYVTSDHMVPTSESWANTLVLEQKGWRHHQKPICFQLLLKSTRSYAFSLKEAIGKKASK